MKKILFISMRNPFSGKYSGDVIRSLKIINLLKTKFEVQVVCLDHKKFIDEKNRYISFKSPNIFFKILNCLLSVLKIQPIQFGLFFSNELKNYINNYANNFDYLFFYHIRSSQYLPKNFMGKTILEMNDLYSDNYLQTFKYLSIFNPLKYLYFFESILMKKVENIVFSNFDRITLLSKNEVKKINSKFKNKIFAIDELVYQVNKKFFFSKKNFRILFIGNLSYLPNLLACRDFIRNILPKLREKSPKIKFSIIGNITRLNRILLSDKAGVEILGSQKNISKFIKNTICGIANLEIATGVQGKVLTYMSFGLPVICSNKVAKNFGSNVIKYDKNDELFEKITNLMVNKFKSNKLSKESIKYTKKLNLNNMKLNYLKLLKF